MDSKGLQTEEEAYEIDEDQDNPEMEFEPPSTLEAIKGLKKCTILCNRIWRNVDSVVDPTQIRDIRLVEDSRMVQRNRYARPTFMILALITAIFNLSSKAGPWAEQKELLTSVAIMARLIP
ncbi:hypothetical protein QE152_g32354 [Popillia japonica]|uniref:Uncharacterized protein n=1 Tax=Popillia japonica TaxID=7064 RepID=A0AAW1IZB9_POPJA